MDNNDAPMDALVIAADVRLGRDPGLVLAEAHKAAAALKDVLDKKPRKVMFNNEQYLEFEDWQTVGRFYGVTAKVTETNYVEYGSVKGFSAKAIALRVDGAEISGAEAECLTDEERWRVRPKYEWREVGGKREKVQIGEEPVPLFQLKSMAQTRACAKALRNVLAWVVVLAGYRPTPSEELDAETVPSGKAAAAQAPPRPSAPASLSSSPMTGMTVTGIEIVRGTTATGPRKGQPWTRYDITLSDGTHSEKGGTFDEDLADRAERYKIASTVVKGTFQVAGKNVNLIDLRPWEAPAPSSSQATTRNPGPAPAWTESVKLTTVITRVVELDAQDGCPLYGLQTEALGPNVFIETANIVLTRAAIPLKRDNTRVQITFLETKAGTIVTRRLLEGLIVAPQAGAPLDAELLDSPDQRPR
ncbi:MAG: hypothetical protein ACREJC_10910 [Tepidisphaeraceae bacterium]